MPSTPTQITNEICTTPGCDRKVRVRGFCVSCYYRLLRHGDIQPKSQSFKWKHRLSEINEETRTAICAECGPVKIQRRDEKTWRCATHANEKAKLYKRAYRQSKKAVLEATCEVCGSSEKICWDHSHKTGLFRGTLCSNCNVGVGLFRDDPTLLRKAALYLEERCNEDSRSTLQT